eukprot:TRINITY_DN1468_c0_g1_i2.p1 TRINITY_DN1468_c0_g1~~TRINITY_DN1468_c0_g1_i2.p1  ORF type:complete len:401 (+),score=130.03 TRINITY_DN1468_c0_g1_i2:3-1205(+)
MCIRDRSSFFFFKQKTAYEIGVRLVGSEMCIRDRYQRRVHGAATQKQNPRGDPPPEPETTIQATSLIKMSTTSTTNNSTAANSSNSSPTTSTCSVADQKVAAMQSLNEENIVLQVDGVSYEQAYEKNKCAVSDLPSLIGTLATVFEEMMEETSKFPNNIVTDFHAKSIPPIGVRDYLTRLSKFTHCSPECFIFALIYIDRFTERHPNFVINSFNVHRLLITSLVVAAKFFDDRYYNNEYYGKVGGVSNVELNLLEIKFLHSLNYKLHVTPKTFYEYRSRLIPVPVPKPTAPPVVASQRLARRPLSLNSNTYLSSKSSSVVVAESTAPVSNHQTHPRERPLLPKAEAQLQRPPLLLSSQLLTHTQTFSLSCVCRDLGSEFPLKESRVIPIASELGMMTIER